MDSKGQLRIAVIKTDGIGDAVLASPFLFELRKLYKDAEITGILSPPGEEVLSGLQVFDRVKTVDPKWLKYKKVFFLTRWLSALGLLLAVNSGKYDIVIGLRWQDRLTSLVLSLCNAKEKYGYDVLGMGFGINHKITPPPDKMPVIERNLRILSILKPGYKFKAKLGFSTDRETEKKIKELTGRIKKYIVFHPVSGHISKDWPMDRYMELAARLSKKYNIFIIGAKTDGRIEEFHGRNIHNLAGVLNVRETGALIRNASFVLGNDSAAVHIASVFGVRSLTLFSGTALHEVWGARGKNSYILAKDVECRQCGLVECDLPAHACMGFSVEEVEKAVHRIISGKQSAKIIIV
jgi:ADP-heptose:LPS heptosyltransferase